MAGVREREDVVMGKLEAWLPQGCGNTVIREDAAEHSRGTPRALAAILNIQ